MWIIYALLSSIFASLVAILGKMGLKGIDSTLATTIRGIIMAIFLVFISLSLGKFNNLNLHSISKKDWIFITLSGIAGAISWIFYFVALKNGPASKVAAIDRTSLVFVVLLAGLFLGEGFGWKIGLGIALMICGAIFITLK